MTPEQIEHAARGIDRDLSELVAGTTASEPAASLLREAWRLCGYAAFCAQTPSYHFEAEAWLNRAIKAAGEATAAMWTERHPLIWPEFRRVTPCAPRNRRRA